MVKERNSWSCDQKVELVRTRETQTQAGRRRLSRMSRPRDTLLLTGHVTRCFSQVT